MKQETLKLNRKKINELVVIKNLLELVLEMMASEDLKDGYIICDDKDLDIHVRITF